MDYTRRFKHNVGIFETTRHEIHRHRRHIVVNLGYSQVSGHQCPGEYVQYRTAFTLKSRFREIFGYIYLDDLHVVRDRSRYETYGL